EDGGDVGPHGADAEVELVGDLLVGGAGEHEADDATPARGELGERGGLRPAGIHGADDGVPVRAGRGEAGGVAHVDHGALPVQDGAVEQHTGAVDDLHLQRRVREVVDARVLPGEHQAGVE